MTRSTVILEFCAECCALVDQPGPCYNCGVEVGGPETRCSGVFSYEDAKRMMELNGFELNIPGVE